jgi:DNA polymerase III delta prime subunit
MSANAQAIMRVIMEEQSANVRFILTCNYVHKVIPEIVSRCQHFQFQPSDKNDIAEYIITILIAERIKFDLQDVDRYIEDGYPDIRRVLNTVQQNSANGKLGYVKKQSAEYSEILKCISVGNWQKARKIAASEVPPNGWEDFYKFLYQNVDNGEYGIVPQIQGEAFVTIAEYLYRHAFVADPEINAAAMIIALSALATSRERK